MKLYTPVMENGKLYCPNCMTYDHRPLKKVADQNGRQLYKCKRCFRLFKPQEKTTK